MISSETITELRPGVPVDGRFLIEDIAGIGGMGVVYRARDLQNQTTVAVKVLRAGGAIARARFAREAAALAALAHPHIVRLLGHGHLDENTPYLVMEWLVGEDLAQRLLRGPLLTAEAVLLILQVAEALAEAHTHGIVHRELSPPLLPTAKIQGWSRGKGLGKMRWGRFLDLADIAGISRAPDTMGVQIRNSTAEFLVFTSQAGEGGIEVRVEDETVWLTQKLIAVLFAVDIRTVSEHLGNIYSGSEL